MAVDTTSARWLGCVVCGDDSELVAVADHGDETEMMCARCGQARLVLVLGVEPAPPERRARAS